MMLFLGCVLALARLPGILQGRINFCCSVDDGESLLSRNKFDGAESLLSRKIQLCNFKKLHRKSTTVDSFVSHWFVF